jgi:hypothetical protein
VVCPAGVVGQARLHLRDWTVDTPRVGRDRFIPLVAAFTAVMVLAACGAGASEAGSSTTTIAASTTINARPPTTGAPSTTTSARSSTNVTPSTVPGLPPETPTGAVAFTPSAADLTAIGDAYATFVYFAGCPVEPVPGQLKTAEITSTGVKWAFGPMQTQPGCTVMQDGRPTNPMTVGPISNPPENAAVFTEQPGRGWRVNYFESNRSPAQPTSSIRGSHRRRSGRSARCAERGRGPMVEFPEVQHRVGVHPAASGRRVGLPRGSSVFCRPRYC